MALGTSVFRIIGMCRIEIKVMKITVIPGTLDFMNIGDTAMLEVAVKRLRNIFPLGEIHILTNDPDRLLAFFPGVSPVETTGYEFWSISKELFSPFSRSFKVLRSLCEFLRIRLPKFFMFLFAIRGKILRHEYPVKQANGFVKLILNSDLVVFSGMGGINDQFNHTHRFLNIIALAVNHAVPTALMGQGVGPINNSILFENAKKILPKVSLISIREDISSLPLLLSLDVPINRILVTGDDAIELAYSFRNPTIGQKIGIGLRVADYSQLTFDDLQKIKNAIGHASKELRADLVSLPILVGSSHNDQKVIEAIIHDDSNIDESFSTQQVISRVSLCRVVVTSSYHAAVFALAQGIPAIGIYKSEYYKNKFIGIDHQFGDISGSLDICADNFENDLYSGIISHWENSEKIQPVLLNYAKKQIDASIDAYKQLTKFVTRKK